VKPVFFGSESCKLYGVYHEADKVKDSGRGILIASPVGHEYIRSYQLVLRMACDLAAQGFHVFRFDYSGLGNSDGQFEMADLDVWQQNLVSAKAELKTLANIRKISIVGIRLGATIALMANKCGGLKIRRQSFWDPIFNGKQYVGVLKKSHSLMLSDEMRFANVAINGSKVPRAVSQNDKNVIAGYMEALGYRYGDGLVGQLKDVNYQSVGECFTRGSISILSGTTEYSLISNIDSSCELSVTKSTNDVYWEDPIKVEKKIVAPKVMAQFMGLIR